MKEKSIYHGLLIYYLREKSRIVENHINIQLILDDDIYKINKWTTDRVKHYLDVMSSLGSLGDAYLCPWCIYYNIGKRGKAICKGCGYGERYGKCIILKDRMTFPTLNENSRYGQIVSKIKSKYGVVSTIRALPEIPLLVQSIKNIYSDLLDGILSYEDMFGLVDIYWLKQ